MRDEWNGCSPLEKVIAFVTRGPSDARELLVFRHPSGGLQLPAGTVEEGEPLVDAVLREVREETGLTDLAILAYLGEHGSPMAPDQCVVLDRVRLVQQPA